MYSFAPLPYDLDPNNVPSEKSYMYSFVWMEALNNIFTNHQPTHHTHHHHFSLLGNRLAKHSIFHYLIYYTKLQQSLFSKRTLSNLHNIYKLYVAYTNFVAARTITTRSYIPHISTQPTNLHTNTITENSIPKTLYSFLVKAQCTRFILFPTSRAYTSV